MSVRDLTSIEACLSVYIYVCLTMPVSQQIVHDNDDAADKGLSSYFGGDRVASVLFASPRWSIIILQRQAQ